MEIVTNNHPRFTVDAYELTAVMHRTDQTIVRNVKRHAGIAGQYSVSAELTYPGESPETITFVASVYGGPIVMVLPSGVQTFVSRSVTDRLGSNVDAEWIAGFLA